MSLRPRSVVRIWDRWVRPEKAKRHICVCPERLLFLRINSEPLYRPHHLLRHAQNAQFLEHDSYVELRTLFRNYPAEVTRSQIIGLLSLDEAQALVATVRTAVTLTEEQKDLIGEKLSQGA